MMSLKIFNSSHLTTEKYIATQGLKSSIQLLITQFEKFRPVY